MKKASKVVIGFLFILPFIVGFSGYLMQGESVLDALYGAFCLYFISEMIDPENILSQIARWISPLATATGVFMAVGTVAARMHKNWISRCKDSMAIYFSSEKEWPLIQEFKNHIVSVQGEEGIDFFPKAKNQIIAFDHDEETLQFLEEHEDDLKDSEVYIKLDKLDKSILKSSKYHFFDLEDIVAEDYWFAHPLGQNTNVAIVGDGGMATKLLDKALLLNLYSLDQSITYHLYGDWSKYQMLHKDMMLMNKDCIVYHEESVYEDILLLKSMSHILVTEDDVELLDVLLQNCGGVPIDLYSPEHNQYTKIISASSLSCFGNLEDVCTRDNVCHEVRQELAKELNFAYAKLYLSNGAELLNREEEWNKLDGFTKESNLASAAYHKVRVKNMDNMDDDTLSRLEHIRWSRFHSLNYWTYGIPESGKAKDPVKRIHNCLCPYEDLSVEDQEKDLEAVKVLLKITNKAE